MNTSAPHSKGTTLVFPTVDRRVLEMSRELPGRRRFKDGELFIDGIGANLDVVLRHFPELAEHGIDIVNAHLGVHRELGAVLDRKAEGSLETDFQFRTTPFQHQLECFNTMAGSTFFALFMEMGTGKTKVLIDDAVRLYQAQEIDRVLVLAPNGVHSQWADKEIPIHSACDDWEATAYYSSLRKKALSDLESRLDDKSKLQWLTIASASLSASKKAQEWAAMWVHGGRTMVILDESHQFKSPSAGRTKFVQKLAPHAAYRRIATGTEVTQGVEDLFTQLRFLHPSILGHSSFYTFRNEYCRTAPIPGAPPGAVRIVGYQNLDKLLRRIEQCSYRATKADCLDLPDKLFITKQVPLTEEQQRLYTQLKKYAAAEIQGQIMEVPLAVTLLMKLQQIVSGFIIDEEGKTHSVKENRTQAVLDILEERRTAIVWARFRHDIQGLAEALQSAGYSVGVYYGDTPEEERRRIVQPGAVDVLIGNPSSAGTGLNLTHFHTSIYFSNSFNAGERWQSEDRTHRIGQSNDCLYIDLVSPGTVDDNLVKALYKKRKLADMVRDGEASALDDAADGGIDLLELLRDSII